MKSSTPKNAIILGATGAVGTQVLQSLLQISQIEKLTLLGRRPVPNITANHVEQHKVDIFEPKTYGDLLSNHQTAICTLGVGQPSKMSKEDFLKIDKQAVLDFAVACKKSGVQHFELLSSVGIDANSSSFFLRAKGELVEEIKALGFERFSVFQPSMILTPTNRYGFLQGVTLKLWPLLKPLLGGGFRKYRGIPVEVLGEAMAKNILKNNKGMEYLQWDDFYAIVEENALV
ncbi:MAG: NAD(P)H-binding protein [Chitinophagales bacterium]